MLLHLYFRLPKFWQAIDFNCIFLIYYHNLAHKKYYIVTKGCIENNKNVEKIILQYVDEMNQYLRVPNIIFPGTKKKLIVNPLLVNKIIESVKFRRVQ